MHGKKVKIIYFSDGASSAKQFEISWNKFLSFCGIATIALLICVSVFLFLFTDFYQHLQLASLTKVNDHLSSELSALQAKFQRVETEIRILEKEDDELRLVADLPKIESDERDVGVGGAMTVAYDMPLFSNEQTVEAMEYQELLNTLERRIELTKFSRQAIRSKLEENNKIMKHTPSIRPLIDGRITDKFGMRLHPIIEKIKRHPGIDISAERGTEVFATAAGVVEKVVTKYKVNQSYGKYVVINHDYGVQTLYGHLSKILVSPGQKVDRWNPIGFSGDTGRATGPHLHYEVRKDGKLEDPLKYILDLD